MTDLITPDDVNGYTNDDSEYSLELWDYARSFLSSEEALELINGDRPGNSVVGLDSLERFATESVMISDMRPPMASQRSYKATLSRNLQELPPRAALHAWQAELELQRSGMSTTEEKIYSIISVLEVGEDLFGVDLTDEVVKWTESLPECETKLDMLEARGAISGDEWYARHSALEAEEYVTGQKREV